MTLPVRQGIPRPQWPGLEREGLLQPAGQGGHPAGGGGYAYVPHQAAKTLKNNITNKIMMCIPDIMNPYYFAMIHGAAVALERFGYSILLEYTMHSRKRSWRFWTP